MYIIYILKCADGKSYTGYTEDLERRLERHNNGYIPATKNRCPLKLITHIIFNDKYKAFRFEKHLKSGSGRAFLKNILYKYKKWTQKLFFLLELVIIYYDYNP